MRRLLKAEQYNNQKSIFIFQHQRVTKQIAKNQKIIIKIDLRKTYNLIRIKKRQK